MTDDKAGGLKDECVALLKGEIAEGEGGRVHTPKAPLIEEAQAARIRHEEEDDGA